MKRALVTILVFTFLALAFLEHDKPKLAAGYALLAMANWALFA